MTVSVVVVFLLYQKGRDSRIFQAQDRAIDDFTLIGGARAQRGTADKTRLIHRMRRLHKFLHEIGAGILFVYKRGLDARR